MSITSFEFFVMVALLVLVYYALPLRYRWVALLVGNGIFWYKGNSKAALVIMLAMGIVTYVLARLLEEKREQKGAKALVTVGVTLLAACMIVCRDLGFFVGNINGLCNLCHIPFQVPDVTIPSPMGISYFALIWIGYLLDVYWGVAHAEKNALKFALFCGYFPFMTSGPIISFRDSGAQITAGHQFDYEQFCFGLQRILWGLMKKLIISQRLAAYVDLVYGSYNTLVGTYVLLAMVLFVLQLYTDFSGCIDIVLGVSQLFGITLPENFDLPFLSKNLSEFWRRWHITLGGWLRDYILYPILKSDLFQAIGKKSKKKFGKKFGKKVPMWIGLLISWFLIGFWHGGGWNYILGDGLYFGILIIFGEMLEPFTDKVIEKLRIRTETFGYRLFQYVRTFVLFTIGLSFFRAYGGFMEGLRIWKSALFEFSPWIFFDGSLIGAGLDAKDWNIVIVFMAVLAISGIIRYYTGEQIRVLVARQPIVFRWLLYVALFASVIVFGCYGIGYDAQSFIYQQF